MCVILRKKREKNMGNFGKYLENSNLGKNKSACAQSLTSMG